MTLPMVSVIIPVFNGMNYISSAIQSVLNQSFADLELLVIDDGSTDGLGNFLESIADDRLRYIRQPCNFGAPAALNRGILESRGNFICWLSHDDLFLREKIEHQIRFLNEHLEFGVCYTDNEIIGADDEVISVFQSRWYPKEEMPWRILTEGNFINGSTVMIRRECFDQAGLFDEGMKFVADGDMWFRMFRHSAFGHLAEVQAKYRWHSGNQSHNLPAMRKYQRLALQKLLLLFPLEQLIPGFPLNPDRTDLAQGHLRVAKALESIWQEPILAASAFSHSWRAEPSVEAGTGILRMGLYLWPRVAVSNLIHRARRSFSSRS